MTSSDDLLGAFSRLDGSDALAVLDFDYWDPGPGSDSARSPRDGTAVAAAPGSLRAAQAAAPGGPGLRVSVVTGSARLPAGRGSRVLAWWQHY